jgi:glycosyltransferase involved in cell wall biosynthesis
VPRIRILFLIDKVIDSGGAERFALGLASHLPADRFDVWIVSTRRTDPTAVAILDAASVTHLSLGRRGKWDVHRFAPLIALLRRERFDVLHSHMFGSNVWGAIFGRACQVPVIIAHEHNWSYSGNRVRIWIDRHLIARLATRFVAVSRANKERMVALEGIPPDKIIVLPTAYIPSAVSSDRDIRAELGLPAATPLVGTAAVLRPEKALDVLIEAHRLLVRDFPDAHLVIAGDGKCAPELARLIAGLPTSDRVHLLGHRPDVDSILAALDVGALSSDWEGMPLFVFECLAAGTPLVATSVGGVPEIIEHGRTGMLVPPGVPVALAAALASLLASPERRTELARAASERIDEFTIEAVADRFVGLYEALVGEAAGTGRLRPSPIAA